MEFTNLVYLVKDSQHVAVLVCVCSLCIAKYQDSRVFTRSIDFYINFRHSSEKQFRRIVSCVLVVMMQKPIVYRQIIR